MTASGCSLCLGRKHGKSCANSCAELCRLNDIVDLAAVASLSRRRALFLPLLLELLAALLADLGVPNECNRRLRRENADASGGECECHIRANRLGAEERECRAVSLAYNNGKLCVARRGVSVSELCKLGCVSRTLSLKAYVESLAVNESEYGKSEAVAEAYELGDSS